MSDDDRPGYLNDLVVSFAKEWNIKEAGDVYQYHMARMPLEEFVLDMFRCAGVIPEDSVAPSEDE